MKKPTLLLLLLVFACAPSTPDVAASASYDDLVSLFEDWRTFERPVFTDGVPDYTAAGMRAQRDALPEYLARLAAIDNSEWPVDQRVDYMMVRAEMHGLDFDHRVRQPWARNPAFYVMIHTAQSDVPAHEGPVMHGWIDLWTYTYPLSAGDAAELAERIGTIPAVLDQARGNLTGDAGDLWRAGIRNMRSQSRNLTAFASDVDGTSAALDEAIGNAQTATDEFIGWLEAEEPSKQSSSGVGRENYTWLLQNVHYVPWSWEEQLTIMERELARSHASLRLEEHRNRNRPPLDRVDNAAEYDRVFNRAVDEYVEFLDEHDIMTTYDYMAPALRAKIGSFSPADGLRGFFSEVSYRNALTMRTHSHHWIELAQLVERPHASPIRQLPSLSNIYDARSEGLATGMEEMMMHAGLFDDVPRARELIWILLAQRAARAIGGLMLHANEWDIEQASEFASKWTPRGWMPMGSSTVLGEQYLYLQQPGYGTSYVTGKIQLEALIAEVALQQGEAFTLKAFFDDFTDLGVVPIALAQWEMTGDPTVVHDILSPQ